MSKLFKYAISFILALVAWAVGTSTMNAQSIPGIYGGGPLGELGTYRYVQLQGASGDTYTLPLNGILNYVGYYIPSSGAFIPGGEYSVYYLNSAQSVIGSAGTVTYSPNSTHTNGVEVSPPNPGAYGALGIQGMVALPPGPLTVGSVILSSSSGVTTGATLNGAGFFSFYYSSGLTENGGFIPAGTYNIEVTGATQESEKCFYIFHAKASGTYSPTNTTNPSSASYYVTNAATNLGTITPTVQLECH